MVRVWWEGTGGRICEEYPLVRTRLGRQQRRRVDALVDDSVASVWLDDWHEFAGPRGSRPRRGAGKGICTGHASAWPGHLLPLRPSCNRRSRELLEEIG